MPVSLRGKVAVVVGASSGIGRATARLFAMEGASVTAAARRENRLRELQEEIRSDALRDARQELSSTLEIQVCDASVPEDLDRLMHRTHENFGRIDFLVYATGMNTSNRAIARLDVETWDRTISVNLNGAYYATRAVLPSMRQNRTGYLIYIASISALLPDTAGAAYQASKRGLLGMAHAIRMEEKENGIRTCVVCCGIVDTEILQHRPVKPSPEILRQALQPSDVAEAILAVAKFSERVVVPEIQVLPACL